MIRRPPRSTQGVSSAASDVYKRQGISYLNTPYYILAELVGMLIAVFIVKKLFLEKN